MTTTTGIIAPSSGKKPKSRLEKLSVVPLKLWVVLVVILTVALVCVMSFIMVAILREEKPEVETKLGRIRGRLAVTKSGKEVREFLHLSYAEYPPVGERRWTHSEVKTKGWNGTLHADVLDDSLKCSQPGDPVTGQEDCLYLSVRAPEVHDDDEVLPVVVWIHGGGLQWGFSDDPGYSADAEFTEAVDAITVNINYRLDLLGFLSRPEIWKDNKHFGNFGIGDAITALHWVKNNIASFGGDPSRVTIVGESSGGTIVLALVTSPLAQGLFSAAFAMSAVPLWKSNFTTANQRRPHFLEQVKCATNATSACLRATDVENLINSSIIESRGWGFYDFPLSDGWRGESMDYNVQEPTILPYLPQDIPDWTHGQDVVRVVVSNTAQEAGYWWLSGNGNLVTTWQEVRELLEDRLEKFLGTENVTIMVDKIATNYSFGVDSDNWWPQMAWDTLITDIRATCPFNDLVPEINRSPNHEVHRVYIEHRASQELTGNGNWTSWHGWDTEAMFGFQYFAGSLYDPDNVQDHDVSFKLELLEMVRALVHGETDTWRADETRYLTNHRPWLKVTLAGHVVSDDAFSTQLTPAASHDQDQDLSMTTTTGIIAPSSGKKPKSRLEKLSVVPLKLWVVLVVILTVALVCVMSFIMVAILREEKPEVETKLGRIRGRLAVTKSGKEVREFLHLSYAEYPPVGERRWTHSEVKTKGWNGTLHADVLDDSLKCSQPGDPVTGQEDCLYLSVRAPEVHDDDEVLPVVVWIHGGGLQWGFSDDVGYSADAEFTEAVDAITVNINYRLDLLGFLSRPEIWKDNKHFGNFGIGDAITALHWVKNNIASFGGDPSRVTIVGESSGGTIVLALVTSPLAQGLFSAAFAMSAVPLWKSNFTTANQRRPDFLEQVKCATNATSACLRATDVENLINSSITESRGWGFYDFPLSDGWRGESMDYNVQEPTILPYLPQDIPDWTHGQDVVRVVVSNTAQEAGYWWLSGNGNLVTTWQDVRELLEDRLEKFLGTENVTSMVDKIAANYSFGVDSDNWWPQMAWDTLITDIRATCPFNDLVPEINRSPNHEVHRVFIEHRASQELTNNGNWTSWHGWDTEAMFGFQYFAGSLYDPDNIQDHDVSFRLELLEMVRALVHGETDTWRADETRYLTNHRPWLKVSSRRPNGEQCAFLWQENFEGWGWQN
eukprot:sb/3461272/